MLAGVGPGQGNGVNITRTGKWGRASKDFQNTSKQPRSQSSVFFSPSGNFELY
jgi:hypothetical protein